MGDEVPSGLRMGGYAGDVRDDEGLSVSVHEVASALAVLSVAVVS